MKARLTHAGAVLLADEMSARLGRNCFLLEYEMAIAQIEASVDRALTPTAEIRQHINGTCWCRYITIPEEYVEWVG